jgi:hypothetical protein
MHVVTDDMQQTAQTRFMDDFLFSQKIYKIDKKVIPIKEVESKARLELKAKTQF